MKNSNTMQLRTAKQAQSKIDTQVYLIAFLILLITAITVNIVINGIPNI